MNGWIDAVSDLLGFVILPICAAILCGRFGRRLLQGRPRLHALIVAVCIAILVILIGFTWNMTSLTTGWDGFGLDHGLAGEIVIVGITTFGSLTLGMTAGTLKAPVLGRAALVSVLWLAAMFFLWMLLIGGHV